MSAHCYKLFNEIIATLLITRVQSGPLWYATGSLQMQEIKHLNEASAFKEHKVQLRGYY